jgi:hypothetical protein
MSTYTLKGRGHAMTYEAPGFAIWKETINVPNFANPKSPDKIVDSNGNDAILASGFSAGDILQVFFPPAGSLVRLCGINVTTVEGGVATMDLGDGDDGDGFLDGVNLNSLGATITGVALGFGADNVMGKLYSADDTIDITFVNAVDAVVFDVFAEVVKVF